MLTFAKRTAFLLGVIAVPQITLASNFTDVPTGIWYANDLTIAQSKAWVSGYKDSHGRDLNRFGPQDVVTIGQALKVAQLAASRAPKTDPCNGCHWAEPYREEAAADYIELNTKNLDRYATRSEVVALVANAFHLETYHTVNFKGGEGTSSGVTSSACDGKNPMENAYLFSDVPKTFRLCAVIAYLHSVNVIHGDDVPEGAPKVFRPHDAISRAEFVRIVVNAWAAFSNDSPYTSIDGPRIDTEGIQAVERYNTYEGGKWNIWNNTDAQATIEFTPPLYRGAPALEVIEPQIQRGHGFTNETVPGEHAFVIKHNQQEFRGSLFIAPDPLKRGW